MKKTKPRKFQIIEYDKTDPGIIGVPKKEVKYEVEGIVNARGDVHIARSLATRKVKVIIYRVESDDCEEK
jgi:hypothetical protein